MGWHGYQQVALQGDLRRYRAFLRARDSFHQEFLRDQCCQLQGLLPLFSNLVPEINQNIQIPISTSIATNHLNESLTFSSSGLPDVPQLRSVHPLPMGLRQTSTSGLQRPGQRWQEHGRGYEGGRRFQQRLHRREQRDYSVRCSRWFRRLGQGTPENQVHLHDRTPGQGSKWIRPAGQVHQAHRRGSPGRCPGRRRRRAQALRCEDSLGELRPLPLVLIVIQFVFECIYVCVCVIFFILCDLVVFNLL